MGNWKWDGFDKTGKKVSGFQEGSNEKEIKKILRAKGIRPLRVNPPSIFELDLGEWLIEKGLARPFGRKELTNFTRQLSIMINAGVPILQSLELLFKQEKHPTLKSTIKKVADDVKEGKTLFEALKIRKGFDNLYCNLIKAGEAGGILDTILAKLAVFLEKQEAIKAKVKSALTYPVVVVIVGMLVIYLMLVFVVPKFQEMLKESGQEVPAITQFVIDSSHFLQENTIYIVPGIFFIAIFFLNLIKSDEGRPVWDRIVMKIPLFGGIVIKGNLSTFSRTLSTMLSAGVSIVDSLDICAETMDNSVMRRDIKLIKQKVTEGKTMAEPLGKIKYFPDMITQMVKVGEATGNIDAMLDKVSQIFEDELNALIDNLTKLIEPLILVVLGGVVAVILIAMYMPIFMSAGGSV